MYYPSAGTNGGHLLDYDEFNTFIYSDFFPRKFGGTRTEFFHRFLASCGGKKIEVIAATDECRVFYTSGGKWGVFLFMSNDNAVDIIRKSEIPIEGFCGVVDGCVEGGNAECCNEFPFMSKILWAYGGTNDGHFRPCSGTPRLESGGGMDAGTLEGSQIPKES